ncbi:MAG: Hsp20/alpha crystallin family protein [Lentimicrobiaceae bacterium]|nr:Hsp20/alpha crystallin family protein [Lentimicrobiaceae bacterium]MDD4599032.1 Hsp20/alpha crystallin family protein [Lentimicrobiaceae bacterium]MDY0026789.1 Hsp20/alpha crystallin family protein [Lentimicrobium sp.]
MLRNKNFFPSIVDEFFGRDFMPALDFQTGINVPSVNIVEGKEDFRIEVAAPGLDKSDFKINVENNVLSISSEKEEKTEENEDRYMRREFSYTSFNRSFSLPQTVDPEKISAKHENGVLTISIPKKEEAKVKPARQIEIG